MKQQFRQRKSGFFVDLLIKIHNLVSMKLTDLFSTVKSRLEFQANYHSVFFNGKTLRMPINPDKEVTELMWPEFYDVSFGFTLLGDPDGIDYGVFLRERTTPRPTSLRRATRNV